MGERMVPASFLQHLPPASPVRSVALHPAQERYLAELLEERKMLGPFMNLFPKCCSLLNQEIRKVSILGYVGHETIGWESPSRLLSGQLLNRIPMGLAGSSMMQPQGFMDANFFPKETRDFPLMVRPEARGASTAPIVKRDVRLYIPVNQYPNFNFIGRLLGPRGNSLKRLEALTECKIFIRGRGSLRDPKKAEQLKDKPGYRHLNEPLHVLVKAEFPEDVMNIRLPCAVAIVEDILRPVEGSRDFYKQQQLKELAELNGTITGGNPTVSPSMSPFNSSG